MDKFSGFVIHVENDGMSDTRYVICATLRN